jgi:hypothetical protein
MQSADDFWHRKRGAQIIGRAAKRKDGLFGSGLGRLRHKRGFSVGGSHGQSGIPARDERRQNRLGLPGRGGDFVDLPLHRRLALTARQLRLGLHIAGAHRLDRGLQARSFGPKRLTDRRVMTTTQISAMGRKTIRRVIRSPSVSAFVTGVGQHIDSKIRPHPDEAKHNAR